VASPKTNHQDDFIAEDGCARAGEIVEPERLLEPCEIQALRNIFLLLDRWDREESDHD
jgi:hypothetical protein